MAIQKKIYLSEEKVMRKSSIMKKMTSILLCSIMTAGTFFSLPLTAEAATVDFKPITFNEDESHYVLEGSDASAGEVTHTIEDGALTTTYAAGNWPGLMIRPAAEDGTWDFSNSKNVLSVDVENTTSQSQALYFKYDTIDVNGKGRIFRASIPANSTSTVYILDSAGSADMALGMQTLPPLNGGQGLVAGEAWTESAAYDPSQVTQITFWMMGNTSDATFVFDNIELVANPYTNPESTYADLLDQFGQYTASTWGNKIDSEEELLASAAEQDAELDTMLTENETMFADRTIYGGWMNEDLKQEATGHFYPTKINNQWTLIDPLGYPYFSTGVDIMRTPDMMTWVSGREYMFQDIPSKDGDLGDHYSEIGYTINPPANLSEGDGFNFYTANLERMYGDDWLTNWVDNAMKRFDAWGMTSLGCWADPDLFYGQGEANGIPYVAHAWSHEGGSYKNISTPSHSIADPFDPAFKTAIYAAIEKSSIAVGDDEWCMGIYVDNEIGWGNAKTGTQHYEVVETVLKDTADNNYSKTHIVDLMESQYGDISALNAAWGTTFASWESLNSTAIDSTAGIPKEDLSSMLSLIADKYYATVSAAVDTYMPNTLYLGSRIAEWGTSEEIVDACVQYVDVLSFNCYKTDVTQDFMDMERYDMPMIIGEFHFNSTESGFFAPGLVPVANNAARGDAYEAYAESALLNGNFVGIHWFQYYDQPVLGRAWDGENTNAGFVDVTDQPYDDLVNSARTINATMYETKFNQVVASDIVFASESIELTADNLTASVGASVVPADATNQTLLYTSSAPSIVEVDAAGMLTAKGEGSATIIVKSEGNKELIKTITVTVSGVNTPAVQPTFPGFQFDTMDGVVVTGTAATSELVPEGIKMTMTANSGGWGNLTKLQLDAAESWTLGDAKELKTTLTNPNNFDIQVRINIQDVDSVSASTQRTLFYNLPANSSKAITIDAEKFGEPGISNDNWNGDGHYGPGLDTNTLKSIHFYLPEGDANVMGSIESASFIVGPLTATAPEQEDMVNLYDVSIEDGHAVSFDGTGSYEAGVEVTVNAGSKDGYNFTGWEVLSGTIALDNKMGAQTTFIMPAEHVQLKATWSKIKDPVIPEDPDDGVTPDTPQPDTSITVTDNETGIVIEAPSSVIPKGTKIQVSDATDSASTSVLNTLAEDFADYILYDISLFYDGESIQPNGMVTVKLPVGNLDTSKKLAVVYVTDSGETMVMGGSLEGDYYVFQTDHFSYYALGTITESTPNVTVPDSNTGTTTPDSNTGATTPQDVPSNVGTSPKTGDNSNIALWCSLLVVTFFCFTWVGYRKFVSKK